MRSSPFSKKPAFFLVTACCVLALVAFSAVFGFSSGKKSDEAANYMVKKQLLSDVAGAAAEIDDYYIYGDHFHLEGTLKVPGAKNASLILRDSNGAEKEYPLSVSVEKGGLHFSSSEFINTGICLDSLSPGSYCVLFRVRTDRSEVLICSEKPEKFEALTYSTVTKNKSSRCVKISCEKFFNRGALLPCLVIKSANEKLPLDVCDIIIDAGHGGTDSGAVCFGHTEAEITVRYAAALAKSLEKAGFRVSLTRDGTEPADAMTPEAAYKKDGRVERACSSGAKLCLSVHLNSNGDGSPTKKGGVQIYCANGAEPGFAKLLADSIVRCAGASLSSQTFCRRLPGVYVRTFSAEDVAASAERMKAAGLEPYESLSQKTTYYYIIRELGGRATGAYIDGRVASAGKNRHCDSRVGIESYLLEIGYINCREDLDNILNNSAGYIEGITRAVKLRFGS